MLARHLLFIATRGHHNTILAIDSVPPHGIVQPPPYISPPMPEECQKDKIQAVSKDSGASRRERQDCERQAALAQKAYTRDARRDPCDNNNEAREQNRLSSCNNYQRACCDQRQIVHMRNARNLQYYATGKNVNQQFYTLPSRRPQRDSDPPRSVTPDITRGLGRGSLSAIHILARHGPKTVLEQDSNLAGSRAELGRRNCECTDAENRMASSEQQQPIVDIRNRFATPLGLTALGYRFFASSPVRDPVTKSSSADALKHNPISPIGHSYSNSFKSSTPTGRSMPTVAERLAQTGSPSSMPNSDSSTPVQGSSGRSTPTNLILSPTKSTMSNEELFAAIHKSKKRLNIKDDNDNMSPYGSTSSLAKVAAGSRHSWSSEPQKSQMVPQNVQPPSAATSRLDFKRLLLQQSVKTGPTRLSAAEQLKLSRQQCQQQQQSPSNVQQTTPLAKVLSPRSVWRFQTPRTDVLSSTIIEDTAAEEKAMKPSPENASPVSRLNARRQLDLCNDLPDMLHDSDAASNIAKCDDRLSRDNESLRNPEFLEGGNQHNCTATYNDCRVTSTSVPSALPVATTSSDRQPQSTVCSAGTIPSLQLTASCQQAINAFESRRISNQLARAQFLAGTPTGASQGRNICSKNVFRARSESPQNATMHTVSRSTSVPTLETAL